VNKDLNDVSQRLVISLLGGGIHAEEELGPCIRVNVLLSPGKWILNLDIHNLVLL